MMCPHCATPMVQSQVPRGLYCPDWQCTARRGRPTIVLNAQMRGGRRGC